MAEQVQKVIEGTIPELKDLQQQNIFTETEIKSIIKKRTDFEYAVRRRGVKQIDFLRYIQYEQALEELRKKRKKRFNLKSKKSHSDSSMVKRIHHLFDRASHRFAGDISLWMEYLKFARTSGSTHRMKRILARAMQLVPLCEEVWLSAAYFEWEDLGSSSGARGVLQRGLRVNDHSKVLWLEYFKLELLFIAKLVERKRVLGLGEEEDEAHKALVGGAVVMIVFDNAVGALGGSVSVDEFLAVVDLIEETYEEIMKETCEAVRVHINASKND